MSAKLSFKLHTRDKDKGSKSYKWLVKIVFGVILFVVLGNFKIAFNSFQSQYLVPVQSEVFHSSKYQPIQVGKLLETDWQDLSKFDRMAKRLNYSGDSVEELATLLAKNTIPLVKPKKLELSMLGLLNILPMT